jgi:hypothetical protein
MKRQKHVFPTNEIPHLWAHQTQDDARNAQGNLFFTGRTIYSYGSHFPIAQHVENRQGERAILLTTRTYSVTTSGHVSAVNCAIPSGTPVFRVPLEERWYRTDAASAHDEHIKSYEERIKEYSLKAARARKNRESFLFDALNTQKEAESYCAFYGLTHSFPIPTNEQLSETLTSIRKSEAIARQQRKEWEDQRKAEAIKQAEEQIKRFRSGQSYYSLWDVPVMLRISDNEIETSKGARVPVDHALRAYRVLKMFRANGKTYQRNGHTIHLGHHVIDSLGADGILHAGCHHIAWEEIEQVGEELLRKDEAKVQTA